MLLDRIEPVELESRYELVEKVGGSERFPVYFGRRRQDGRVVAVKRLPGGRAMPMARVEGKSPYMARHPHLLPTLDFVVGDTCAWIVTPFMARGSLADRVWFGDPLPQPVAIGVLYPIADALDKMHSAGLVHQDVKPGNVLLDVYDRPMLADFGLVVWERSPYILPRSGGTPGYMAPEVERGIEAGSPASDVYSFAVMAREILIGARSKDLDVPVPRPPTPERLADSQLDSLRAGMSRRAVERPASCVELLRPLLRELGAQSGSCAKCRSVVIAFEPALARHCAVYPHCEPTADGW